VASSSCLFSWWGCGGQLENCFPIIPGGFLQPFNAQNLGFLGFFAPIVKGKASAKKTPPCGGVFSWIRCRRWRWNKRYRAGNP
jgi:hypothetical protein